MINSKAIGKTSTASFFDDNGYFVVVYHGSVVFRFHPTTKQVLLNNHGFYTATTKKRMNEALKACGIVAVVDQVKGKWFLRLIKDTGASLIPFDNGTCEFIA